MLNREVEELYKYVEIGMIVNIHAGINGFFEKGLTTLVPGDRGSSVLEVQRKMKDQGYYSGSLDGVYG